MSYSIVKGVSQMKVDAKEIESQIYLPLEAFWDDYTILKSKRVIFIDSPIHGLQVGILNINPNICDASRVLEELLAGAGCKVKILEENSTIPTDLNLILELNPAEGVYHVGYAGYRLNGSRRLATDISWAMTKIFELDAISPPAKEKQIKSKTNFWKKISVPIISIKWRKGEDSELFLAISILLGLFRFASMQLPIIDENIFALNPTPVENPVYDPLESHTKLDPKPGELRAQEIKQVRIADTAKEEDVELMKKQNEDKKQGRLVSNPSPKLQAYMKKIIAEQNAKAQKEEKGYPKNIAPMDVYKKSGLGKG